MYTVVHQYSIDQHFVGGVEWTNAVWQGKTETWLVTLREIETGQLFTQEYQILISAVGGLVKPQDLKVPGLERFLGKIIHTARWNHDIDLSHKNVAVIGNGGK